VPGSGAWPALAQQRFDLTGEEPELLAARRAGLFAAQLVDGFCGARVGDLDEAQLVELPDDTLDLVSAPEDPHFGHGHEHAATPLAEAAAR
jgi:hypothetical protein